MPLRLITRTGVGVNYENRIVAFIDILGFKELVNQSISIDSTDDSHKIDELNKVLISARRILDIDDPEKGLYTSRMVTQFSDSMVLSYRVDEESSLFNILINILHLVINLLADRILCRGGISYGKIIHTDKVIFGPALISAYDTESKAALYPRIIIDTTIIKKAIEYRVWGHTAEDEQNYISEIVSEDTDQMYYVDYFLKAESEFDNLENDMPDHIKNLQEIIDRGILSEKPDLRVKYGWLANKYNSLLNEKKNPDHIRAMKESGNDELIELANYYESLKFY
jgi:hypothetical protein